MATVSTVVGVFETATEAEQAITDLRAMGLREDQLGLTGREWRAGEWSRDPEGQSDSFAAEGATAGVIGGASVGLLWGLGALSGTLPVIGPAVAAGTLAAVLSSAATGAAAAGLGGLLIGMGIPREEAAYYEAEVGRGRFVLTADATGQENAVRRVMQENGAFDYSSRPEEVSLF